MKKELSKLIEKGESENLEFKPSLSHHYLFKGYLKGR